MVSLPVNVYEDLFINNIYITEKGYSFKSKNMKRFVQNFSIIERLIMNEEKDLNFIAKWLKMSAKQLVKCIINYFKTINKRNELDKLVETNKRSRKILIKYGVETFISDNQNRCFAIKDILDFMQYDERFNNIREIKYHDINNCLRNDLKYSWRKAGQRCPNNLRDGLSDDRIVFQTFVNKLKTAGFLIVYIDECSFNAACLPLYTWMPKGQEALNVIRPTNLRYNCIAARWNDEVYFQVKQKHSDENGFSNFLNQLNNELKSRISKNYYAKRTVFLLDNATIHKTPKIKREMKRLKMVVFTIPPYTPEMNKIEHTFGILKNKIAKRNLNIKDFLHIIQEEINGLYN
jgi:hypothetical protein